MKTVDILKMIGEDRAEFTKLADEAWERYEECKKRGDIAGENYNLGLATAFGIAHNKGDVLWLSVSGQRGQCNKDIL